MNILKKILIFVLTAAVIICAVPCVRAQAQEEVIDYELTFSGERAVLEIYKRDPADIVYFTANGERPTQKSRQYTRKLSSSVTKIVRAAEYDTAGNKIATLRITLRPRALAPDTKLITEGTEEYLELSTGTEGGVIYYTTDGSKPSSRKTLYTERIALEDGMTVRACTVKEDKVKSEITEYRHISRIFTSEDEKRIYEELLSLREEFPEGMEWGHETAYKTAVGCAAFANMITDRLFGDAPARKITDFSYSDIRVGDIVRIDNDYHSVIILEKYEDHVIVVEGNYAKQVRWGRRINRAEIESGSYIKTRYADELSADTEEEEAEPEDEEPEI